ncbi:GntR family transcriptional regulator [Streptomyces olivaceoviridis]
MPAKRPMSAQVRDRLVELFRSRGLVPGDQLPSEAEIAELCGVGRSTAREALKLLEQEGMVVAERGRGRFMSPLGALKVERPITRFESISSMLEALGYQAHTVVLSVAEQAPGDVVRGGGGGAGVDPPGGLVRGPPAGGVGGGRPVPRGGCGQAGAGPTAPARGVRREPLCGRRDRRKCVQHLAPAAHGTAAHP